MINYHQPRAHKRPKRAKKRAKTPNKVNKRRENKENLNPSYTPSHKKQHPARKEVGYASLAQRRIKKSKQNKAKRGLNHPQLPQFTPVKKSERHPKSPMKSTRGRKMTLVEKVRKRSLKQLEKHLQILKKLKF